MNTNTKILWLHKYLKSILFSSRNIGVICSSWQLLSLVNNSRNVAVPFELKETAAI